MIENRIIVINAKGYRINNLYQRPDDMWVCSLRKSETLGTRDFFEYGFGPSAEEALKVALHNAELMSSESYMSARKKVIREL